MRKQVDVLVVGGGPTRADRGHGPGAAGRRFPCGRAPRRAPGDLARGSRACKDPGGTERVRREPASGGGGAEGAGLHRSRPRYCPAEDRLLAIAHRVSLHADGSPNETEAIFEARLAELGHELHRGVEIVGLGAEEDHVTATTAEGDEIDARCVVGADGMHSRVREAAGIEFEGGSYEQSFVLADVRMDWALDPREVMLFFSGEGLVVVAPLPGGRHRIVATADDAPEAPPLVYMQAILARRGPVRERAAIREIVWSSRFHVHHRIAARFVSGRIFLAGDAGHVHSPAGGQGMNTGIQDAAFLAALLGRGESYDAERLQA